MPLNEEKKRLLAERAAQFAGLANHPAWPTFEQAVEQKVTRLREAMLRRALGGNDQAPPLPQREIDYMRGFINGMRYLIAVPNGAEARLEAYLQEQERKARNQQRSDAA
jgi:hypothetical protein